MTLQFLSPTLLSDLANCTAPDLDELDFGVIAMERDGIVVQYNAFESSKAGLSPDRVIGLNFFTTVGPCTNNYLIAQRYMDEDEIDDVINYVFTLRMKPTPVRLRMLKGSGAPLMYLVVERLANNGQ